MKDTVYTLPEISFVAGQTKKFAWNTYDKNGDKFDGSSCVGNFAVIDYSARYSECVISKDVSFIENDEDTTQNVLLVELLPEETLNLNGKYIYQITIKDTENDQVDIPDQGIMFIYQNINKDYITDDES